MSVVLVTGADASAGSRIAGALGEAGHRVYAANATAPATFAGDVRPIELDVRSDVSAQVAVDVIVTDSDRLDVVVHGAGRLAEGVAEAFTVKEMAALFDTNVFGAQRVNRAALPVLRDQASGLLVWIGSATTRGGHPPFMGPYVAAKAAEDLLAQTYAYELARFGIETTIVVSGVLPDASRPADEPTVPADAAIAQAYDRYAALLEPHTRRRDGARPADDELDHVAAEVVRIVALPHGRRPFRVVVDPAQDGAETVTEVAERVRVEFARRAGITDLLRPAPVTSSR